jgi:hypothetical protein
MSTLPSLYNETKTFWYLLNPFRSVVQVFEQSVNTLHDKTSILLAEVSCLQMSFMWSAPARSLRYLCQTPAHATH